MIERGRISIDLEPLKRISIVENGKVYLTCNFRRFETMKHLENMERNDAKENRNQENSTEPWIRCKRSSPRQGFKNPAVRDGNPIRVSS